MADRKLENLGTMDGTYAGALFAGSQSSLLEVTMAEVPFLKSADQSIWFSGELTVTFTIDNRVGAGPLETIVVKDLLDNTKFKFIEDSVVVQITDTTTEPPTVTTLEITTDYTVIYVAETPEDATKDSLEIAFLAAGAGASIPVGSVATISFRGSKVPA